MTAVKSRELTKLKGVFGVAKWAAFVNKMPKWESQLAKFNVDTLDAKLQLCGFDPLSETPDMANALVEYFASKKRKRDDDEGKPKPIRPILESNFLPLDQANLFVQIVDNLASAAAKNGFVPIKLEDCEPSLDHTLFIREPYKEVWGSILKANKCRAVVSGTPGIGKSSITCCGYGYEMILR